MLRESESGASSNRRDYPLAGSDGLAWNGGTIQSRLGLFFISFPKTPWASCR